MLAELRELRLIGFGCNVQTYDGLKETNVELCKARRAESRRLLRKAIEAIS